jgi:hypothetical protein
MWGLSIGGIYVATKTLKEAFQKMVASDILEPTNSCRFENHGFAMFWEELIPD